MSSTLGEKLRQAREERGITLSEVADQTRISGLYIESIENDDYRNLPGGIFNKGFVKSFAKYVGVDEQEALQDYANLTSSQGTHVADEPKTYRPEVLTDDRSSSSIFRKIIFAAIILGLGTFGILTLLKYLQNNSPSESANTAANLNANVNSSANSNAASAPVENASAVPSLNNSKIEFKALKEPVSIVSAADDKKASSLVTPDKSMTFEPKQNLKISYAKSQAQNVQLTINGKPVNLPSAPANPKRNAIEWEITGENFKQIWDSGAISFNQTNAAVPK